VDSVHGGHLLYATTPRLARQELSAHGFDVLESVDAVSSGESWTYTAPGYYYVARKSDAAYA